MITPKRVQESARSADLFQVMGRPISSTAGFVTRNAKRAGMVKARVPSQSGDPSFRLTPSRMNPSSRRRASEIGQDGALKR